MPSRRRRRCELELPLASTLRSDRLFQREGPLKFLLATLLAGELLSERLEFPQRVPFALVEPLPQGLDHADIVIPVGGGCTALRVSRRQVLDQSLRGELRGCVDRLAHIAVVRSDHTGEIVTVLHDRGGRRGRRYRRPH